MKKITIIGDIHGRSIWKEILQKELSESDLIIFTGDYHDPYQNEFSLNEHFVKKNSIENLKEIVRIKQLYPNQIILLLGNHDTHYLYLDILDGCSRFDFENRSVLHSIFSKNKELFQYAYQINNNLFIHGGLTNFWLNHYREELIKLGLKDDYSNLADIINIFGHINKNGIETVNDIGRSRGGWAPYGGPTWADTSDLFSSFLFDIELNQYVGHNRFLKIQKVTGSDINIPDSKATITFCDVLGEKDLKLEEKYLKILI